MTKFRKTSGKPDTILLFATRIKLFVGTVGRLGLADPEECNAIYTENPRELFARFMEARITRIGSQNGDN